MVRTIVKKGAKDGSKLELMFITWSKVEVAGAIEHLELRIRQVGMEEEF